MTSPLANVPGIELVQAGQWDLGSGRVTFTRADLASAVAALDCPAVHRPVLKLGHDEPMPENGKRWDGEPAVGWVANMALAEGGATIVGDYVGMPGWLGDILASAYPNRSIEGMFDYRCQIGHTHPFVLTAVALLGVVPPGVGTLKSLQDVAALYGVQAASNDGAGEPVTVTIHASKEDIAMPNPRPREVAAGVSVEDVRRAYYDNAPEQTWICEIQLDPLQLIVMDDNTGGYVRVPINVAADGEGLQFGQPIPVTVEYVDQSPDQTAVAASRLVFASRIESQSTPAHVDVKCDAATADKSVAAAIKRVAAASGLEPASEAPQTPPAEPEDNPTPNEGAPMALDEGLRQRLGLAEDADEATILTALDEKLNTPEPTDEQPTPEQPAEPELVAASGPSLPDGVVQIDKEQLAELKAQAAEGVAARAQQRTEARDRVLDDAVHAGKFAPARRDHWARLYDADPEGTKQTLASLEAGLVPVADKGAPGGEDAKDAFDAEFDNLFPRHMRAEA